MTHLIYLKVAKVGTQNADMTTSIERTVITLESGKNFNSFVKHLHVQNYLTDENEKPRVLKAVEWKHGKEGKEVDKVPYAKQVSEALSVVQNAGQAIDYKALSEQQSNKISEMEQMMKSFNERLKASETKAKPSLKEEIVDDALNNIGEDAIRMALETKANELSIKFNPRIGSPKLLEKIQAVEPEFNIN